MIVSLWEWDSGTGTKKHVIWYLAHPWESLHWVAKALEKWPVVWLLGRHSLSTLAQGDINKDLEVSWCFHLVKMFIMLQHSPRQKIWQHAAGFNSLFATSYGDAVLYCSIHWNLPPFHFTYHQVYFEAFNSFKNPSALQQGKKGCITSGAKLKTRPAGVENTSYKPDDHHRLTSHGEFRFPGSYWKSNDFQGKCNSCSLSVSVYVNTVCPHAASSLARMTSFLKHAETYSWEVMQEALVVAAGWLFLFIHTK